MDRPQGDCPALLTHGLYQTRSWLSRSYDFAEFVIAIHAYSLEQNVTSACAYHLLGQFHVSFLTDTLRPCRYKYFPIHANEVLRC
jgi:hypothetical protein